MQYNHIFNLKKDRKHQFLTLIKTGVFVFVVIFISISIKKKEHFGLGLIELLIKSNTEYPYLILIPIALFIINWSIEAFKWKLLCDKVEKISFYKALQGVLTGVALGFITPFSLGDYFGRIFQLQQPDRTKAIGAVFVSRIFQFYITLILGSFSLIYYFTFINKFNTLNLFFISIFLVFVNAGFCALFFLKGNILRRIKSIRIFQRISPYFDVLSEYSQTELYIILLLSLVRYLVFTFQFMLILILFNISSNVFLLFLGVNFIFFAKSVIPTFFDLGVRESAAVYFFSFYSSEIENILYGSLCIWIINIILPALIGLFFIFRLKIFTDN